MNWPIFLSGAISALAAIEIYYALQTSEVALPFFGVRRQKADHPVLYWVMLAFWTTVVVSNLFYVIWQ